MKMFTLIIIKKQNTYFYLPGLAGLDAVGSSVVESGVGDLTFLLTGVQDEILLIVFDSERK